MTELKQLVQALCELDGPSGNEDAVRSFILEQITDTCEAQVDASGNILAFKKGAKPAAKKLMVDAHMDEVGVIVTGATESGLLRFDTVGGIEAEALLCKRVRFGNILGVIGAKPIHQSTPEERKALPKRDHLLIDIGATDKENAEQLVSPGSIGTFVGTWAELGGNAVRAKALDDRIGCAILIRLLQQPAPYDFYATFTVGEELGLRGAKTAAFAIDPEVALALETTTADDLHGSEGANVVCQSGKGVVVPFMDRTTLYDRRLYDLAFSLAAAQGIPIQTKHKVSGGNNAGAISLSKGGVPTLTLSAPCRYIHSGGSVVHWADVMAQEALAAALIEGLAGAQE